MEYTQHNPLPLPEGEEFREVEATINTIFDWKYELERQNLLGLYEKGKTLAWNANDLDWTIDVDIERMMQERLDNGMAAMVNEMMGPPMKMSDEAVMRMQLNMNAFMLSQFLHGEQGALIATAKIVQGVPWEEAKFYAANQVADEARHVEVYHRYLTEKLGVSYEIVPSLRIVARRHRQGFALGHHLPRHADHGRGPGAWRRSAPPSCRWPMSRSSRTSLRG